MPPCAWLLAACDGKFVDEDLNDEGQRFAGSDYGDAEPNYFGDLAMAIGDRLPGVDHLPDTWRVYDQPAPLLACRFASWKKQRSVWKAAS